MTYEFSSANESRYLRAIAEAPDDKKAYQAYQQYLEDRDDPRACSVADYLAYTPSLANYSLLEKAARTWYEVEPLWSKPLKHLGITPHDMHMGVPSGVIVEVKEFLEKGAEMLDIYPQLTVRLLPTRKPEDIEQLKTCPHIAKVTSLDLQHNENAAEILDALSHNPGFAKVKRLNISNNRLTDEVIEKLFSNASTLGQLRHLNASINRFGSDAVKAIADSPRSDRLQKLEFFNNHINDRGFKHIADSQHLGELSKLVIGKNRNTETGEELIRDSKNLTNLADENFGTSIHLQTRPAFRNSTVQMSGNRRSL